MVKLFETGDGLAQVYLFPKGEYRAVRRALNLLLPDVCMVGKSGNGEAALTVIPEGAEIPEDFRFPPGMTVIASSAERGQLQRLASLPVRVITCGLGSRDTVTFSSRQEGRGVVSLLRTLEGVEPLDIPLDIPAGCGDYPVLAAAAVRIFLSTGREIPEFASNIPG